MFGTPILDVAIGLVFCFAATALAASTVTEALASALKWRAGSLVAGVKTMLNDKNFSGLARSIFNHALVNPGGNGKLPVNSKRIGWSGPSYIEADNFATAAIEILQGSTRDLTGLKSSIDAIGDDQLKQLLSGMYDRANGRVEDLHKELSSWFDSSMDRVSGVYKRKTQWVNFVIGLVLAVALNVDATSVAQALWKNPALAKEIATEKGVFSNKTTFAEINTKFEALPVGLQLIVKCDDESVKDQKRFCGIAERAILPSMVFGWLLTGIAAVFGAPFWFDILQNLVQLRGTGPKPTKPT